ncbi:hypothetical protein NDI76_19245 [Halogeometricum sp. S1BR25-6]|uniref:Uncharacterized protein n=1 Tax=Halogeometricum salsisoli TaxID=2950536 RepID=A0ABU2GJC3_9EURY|nr:hypothetical protein [Halogeometricum sp. S1BR25-6]MDS0300890.1 hypothetical protein [Halogeometricum sp. S1BR25-6]
MSGNDYDDLRDRLKELSSEERAALLKDVEAENELPIIGWSSNPEAVKAAFKYVEEQGTVTFEDLRQHLHDEEHIEAEQGSYNFGIIDTEREVFFKTDGDREAGTEITLNPCGKEYAEIFDESDYLRPIEKTLLIGMQPYGSGLRFLGILEENREDGILRENLQEQMVEEYEGSGKYFTGYYGSWYSKLGLVDKERVGRKVKYKPAFPSAW